MQNTTTLTMPADGPVWGPSAQATAAAIAAVLLYLLRLMALPKPIPGIPYDKASANKLFGDIGNIAAAPSRRNWFLDVVVRHKSPLFQIFSLPFSKPILLCADPVESQDVCMRRLKDFQRGKKLSAIFGGAIPNHHINMDDDDPRLKKNKELLRDLMTPAFLHEVSAPRIYDNSTRFVELWEAKSRMSNGRPLEAGHDIHHLSLDIIMSVAFNWDPSKAVTARNTAHFEAMQTPDAAANHHHHHHHQQDNDDEEEPLEIDNLPLEPEIRSFSLITASIGVAFKSSVPRIRHWFLRHMSPLKEAMAAKDEMIARELERAVTRMEAGEPPRCAMDQMLLRERAIAAKAERQPNYLSDTIKDELLGYLVAGHETTSSALQWGLKSLSRNQPAQARLRAALRTAFPDAAAAHRPPSLREILGAQIPYLDAVIEEILRCSKTLPMTSREARVDTHLLGHAVPKGTIVMFLVQGPGYQRPALPVDDALRVTDGARRTLERTGTWDPDNVEQFVPERWLKTERCSGGDGDGGEEREVFDPSAGPMMVFGYGPRSCFGRRLAYLEMRILLCLLFWTFELEQVSGRLDSSEPLEELVTFPRFCYVKLKRTAEA